jgi:integrase
MSRQLLTDRLLRGLPKKPAAKGKHYDIMDSVVPGLGVRVSDTGHCTFVLVSRYPGSTNPTRRRLSEVGAITPEAARVKAQQWLELIGQGRDPADVEEQARAAELRRQGNTFAAVAEDFIRDKLPTERKGSEVERDIRRDLISAWGKRPISEITRSDIRKLIVGKKATAPAQARNTLGIIKRLFTWAVDKEDYGLEASPANTLKPTLIIGDKVSGSRILTNDELFALWRAAERMPYPHGPAYKVLMLTALRLNEAARATWSEFNFTEKVWIIPAARMKGKNTKARPHAVPLADDLVAILENLPRFNSGDHLFSTTSGASPAWMTDKVKKRVDARMLRTLRALARRRGDDPDKLTLPHWTNHDIRRSVRSQLSRLKVSEEAREAVMAHARPGIKGVYDHHDYLDEKREALKAWGARLRDIVEPAAGERGAIRGDGLMA